MAPNLSVTAYKVPVFHPLYLLSNWESLINVNWLEIKMGLHFNSTIQSLEQIHRLMQELYIPRPPLAHSEFSHIC